jgi:hypothetical protein
MVYRRGRIDFRSPEEEALKLIRDVATDASPGHVHGALAHALGLELPGVHLDRRTQTLFRRKASYPSPL